MCGIAGIAHPVSGPAPDRSVLEDMARRLRHRGPDDQATDVQGTVGFAMRRLAVIDVEGGQQPFWNEDRTVRAVFNGEIYNFRDLRRELERQGHRFRSDTDGEVLVHAWEEHGPDLVRHLDGMFAFALHDTVRDRLFLARDRFGIKPLYWTRVDDGVAFGSEVKALLASPRVRPDLDVDPLGEFLAWEYVPAPRTLMQGVEKLRPGSQLQLDLRAGDVERNRWYSLPRAADGLDTGDLPSGPGEWREAVDARLEDAVERQMVSDVPLGAFLSGGVDSSLVVAKMGGTARTFSIGFDDPTYDETPWAARVAEHLGVSHRVEILRPDVRDLFDRVMRQMDDPIGDFSIFPTYLVSRLAREEVKVVLTGDGGDELFGGYETYRAQELAALWELVPSPLRKHVLEPALLRLPPRSSKKKGMVNKALRFAQGLQHPREMGHARWRIFAGTPLREEVFTPEARRQLHTDPGDHLARIRRRTDGRHRVDRGLLVDIHSYLPDNILVKMDRMSMAASLEARVPFLDHRLAELALRMPPGLKVRWNTTKPLLKRLASRYVPRECVYRPKEGFSIPLKNWLRGPFRPILEDRLAPGRLRDEGIFRPETVDRLKREHMAGTANHSHVLWSMLVFEDWRDRWGV
ncbi:MAG: asparagine synthase (glutamine-hydrolyzing) [Gemmatimonadota bacterium]